MSRGEPQRGEHSGGCNEHVGGLRFLQAGHRRAAEEPRAERVEGGLLRFDRQEDRRRHANAVVAEAFGRVPDDEQVLRLVVRKRPQQHGVHHA